MAMTKQQQPEDMSALDRAIPLLRQGASSLAAWSLAQRREMAAACVRTVTQASDEWVEVACDGKRIPAGSKSRAEEITGGPLATVRQLQLLIATFDDLQRHGRPILPGPVRRIDGQLRVPVFPTQQLYDALLFGPLRAETWLQPEVTADEMFDPTLKSLLEPGTAVPKVVCVLGAGNVTSIPATDTLSKIFQENKAVLLKVNPVNEYIGGILKKALSPLIAAGVLQVVSGGKAIAHHAIHHPEIDEVHITGATETHGVIVWGTPEEQRHANLAANSPVLNKPITSELGNVTPWAIVPGNYSRSELRFQAENIAASITNNASFNCVATKLIITSRQWPQREEFLQEIETALARTPARNAYYPGAADRYERFAERQSADTVYLPWTLRRNIDPEEQRHLLEQESFVCVCGEVGIDADSEAAFLQRAVAFMNEQVWGTLAASLTVPKEMQRSPELMAALGDLRYGTICVNQWSAVAFALMSPPWGAYPGATIRDPQSGIGFVHNTFMLNRPQKTIMTSPAKVRPKPVWFASHRCPESLATKLLELYNAPSPLRLPALVARALIG